MKTPTPCDSPPASFWWERRGRSCAGASRTLAWCGKSAKLLVVNTQWSLDAGAAIAELEGFLPGLALESELAHREAWSKAQQMSTHADLVAAAVPDLFRLRLTDRLRALGLGEDVLRSELRNGISLYPEPGVRIRILKAADDDGSPRRPGSRTRAHEFDQMSLDLSYENAPTPELITLVLSWTDTAMGLTLHLCMPRGAPASRFNCDTYWSLPLSHPLEKVSAGSLTVDNEVDEDDDLEGYQRRQEQTGDEPA